MNDKLKVSMNYIKNETYCKGCKYSENGSCPFSNSIECQDHNVNDR